MEKKSLYSVKTPTSDGYEYDFIIKSDELSHFALMSCQVKNGLKTRYHRHHDNEIFIIVNGEGVLKSSDDEIKVKQGDILKLPPGTAHELIASMESSNLDFISLYWSNPHNTLVEDIKKLDKQFFSKSILVTATPPTPNGPLHLGHLSGPYLGADVYRRAQFMRGKKVLLGSGLDESQSYVELKALQNHVKPEEVAKEFGQKIKQVWQHYSMLPDSYTCPSEQPYYKEYIQSFFAKIAKKGAFYKKEVKQPYCKSCFKWLFEAHVRGKCPHCKSICDGNTCESCGLPNDCFNMESPVCRICHKEPEMRYTELLYFPLNKYKEKLKNFWNKTLMPPHMRALCRRFEDIGFPDFAIGHNSSWGEPIPDVELQNHTLYAWVEMAASYYFVAENLGIPLSSKEDFDFVQFFGFDNAFFHAILFPALWFALDKDLHLPNAFICNEFYLLDETKFSTSRMHAIWGHELIGKIDPDLIRYFLSSTRPETKQSNFSWVTFKETIENDLYNGLNKVVQLICNEIESHFNGITPEAGEWTYEHDTFIDSLKSIKQKLDCAYGVNQFSTVSAIQELRNLIKKTQSLLELFSFSESSVNHIDRAEYRTTIVLSLTALQVYAFECYPIMPNFSERLKKYLGIDLEKSYSNEIQLFPSGIKIKAKNSFLFEKSYEELL